ncbi:MAG: hypothetical protein AVDCRST_MAG25-2681, partial [uncultured Rubrobacteraceae bacterium]
EDSRPGRRPDGHRLWRPGRRARPRALLLGAVVDRRPRARSTRRRGSPPRPRSGAALPRPDDPDDNGGRARRGARGPRRRLRGRGVGLA